MESAEAGGNKQGQVAKGRSRRQWLPSLPPAFASCISRLRLPPAHATCICLLLLTSCLSYKQVELVDITNVAVEKVDAKGIAVRVDALIKNPNGYKIKVLDPDVDLFLNDKFIGKAILDSAFALDRKSTRLYSVPLHAEVKGGSLLMMLLTGALGGNEVTLGAKGTVVGKAGLLRKRFPFEMEEQLEF